MSSNPQIDQPTKPPRLRRFLVRLVFVLVCLLTLLVACTIVEGFRGRAAWRAYAEEATARGVKLDFAAFIPPAIPDAENFASIPIFEAIFRAADAQQTPPNPCKLPVIKDQPLPSLTDPYRGKRIDLTAWQRYFVEVGLLPKAGENPAADVLQALDHFAAPLAELRAAGTRPHCRFPVHWERGFEAGLPHFGMFMDAAKLFALRTSAHLAAGDSAAAYDDFQTGLRLTTATFEEPTLFGGLVRISTAVLSISAVWGGLAEHQWAAPELLKIEANLAALDWLRDYHFSMASERGGLNFIMDTLITRPQRRGEILRLMAGVSQQSSLPSSRFYRPLPGTGWLYQNKVRANRFFDQMLARIDPAQRRLFPDRAVTLGSEHFSLLKKWYYAVFAMAAPVLEGLENHWLYIATITDEARLACALERCRLARGAFPESLSELAPHFLGSLPAEIVNGEPYRFRRSDDGGYVLYSVGPDLQDDGGVPFGGIGSGLKQPDWVWGMPGK